MNWIIVSIFLCVRSFFGVWLQKNHLGPKKNHFLGGKKNFFLSIFSLNWTILRLSFSQKKIFFGGVVKT